MSMTKDEVKAILDYSSTKHDNYITTCIPLFVEFAQDYCNNQFKNESDQIELKGGVKLFVAKAVEFNLNKSGQKSRDFGEVRYSYDTDFPPSLLKLLQPYSRIRV